MSRLQDNCITLNVQDQSNRKWYFRYLCNLFLYDSFIALILKTNMYSRSKAVSCLLLLPYFLSHSFSEMYIFVKNWSDWRLEQWLFSAPWMYDAQRNSQETLGNIYGKMTSHYFGKWDSYQLLLRNDFDPHYVAYICRFYAKSKSYLFVLLLPSVQSFMWLTGWQSLLSSILTMNHIFVGFVTFLRDLGRCCFRR